MLMRRWHATIGEAVCVFQQRMHPEASGGSSSMTLSDRASLAAVSEPPSLHPARAELLIRLHQYHQGQFCKARPQAAP